MLVITPLETVEVDSPTARLTPAELSTARRKARVALRLAVIEMWERDQSPLAANRP